MSTMARLGMSVVALMLCLQPALAESPAAQVATRACGALLSRVHAVPGTEPAFLRSYDPSTGGAPTIDGAYTYDNALAVIALVACGHRDAALRIADALAGGQRGRSQRRGGAHSQHLSPRPRRGTAGAADGLVERSGWPLGRGPVSRRHGHRKCGLGGAGAADGGGARRSDDPYRAAAARLARWAKDMLDPRAPAGFIGGLYGYDDTAERLTWKSTEHNTDLAAVFDWLARLEPDRGWEADARTARAFVAALWDPASGHFWVGTAPDGVTPNRRQCRARCPALAAAAGGRARTVARFAPLCARRITQSPAESISMTTATASGGREPRRLLWLIAPPDTMEEADRLLSAIADQFSPGGFIWASSELRLTTGLALSPASPIDDFYYYRLPHLAPTAWAALAATGWNPFTGEIVSKR